MPAIKQAGEKRMNDKLKDLSQYQIEALALKGLETEADNKRYSLYHITQDLIAELEGNKEEILEHEYPQDLVSEYVDSNISVYTYEQIMIYANNHNALRFNMYDNDCGNFQDAIVSAIYSYLAEQADAWLFEQEQAKVEA
tara:strand:+ start:278 stop:697 length:420 start_codon:yes stop_codon:yes gene_type:complete